MKPPPAGMKWHPLGGVKQSGKGRMLSNWIFNELTQVKMTLFDLAKVKK